MGKMKLGNKIKWHAPAPVTAQGLTAAVYSRLTLYWAFDELVGGSDEVGKKKWVK